MNTQVMLWYQQSTIYTELHWSVVASYLRRGSSDHLWQRVRQEPQRFVWHLGCVQHPSTKRVCCPQCSISTASANKPSLSTRLFCIENMSHYTIQFPYEFQQLCLGMKQKIMACSTKCYGHLSVRPRAGPTKVWLWLSKACATRQMPCCPIIFIRIFTYI